MKQNEQTGFILGAGFSMAVSESMPNMAKLFEGVIETLKGYGQDNATRLASRLDGFSHTDLESLLTYLSSDEPWLSESNVLRNRADFLEVSTAIGEYIQKCQRSAFEGDYSWAGHFIKNCTQRSVTMVSLNYDLIVETLIGRKYSEYYTVNFPSGLMGEDSFLEQANTLISNIGTPEKVPEYRSQFRLHKLHGSLNWYYSGGVSDIYDIGLKDIARGHDDKVPLIVPPTFSKSSYFNNPKIKSIWRSAYFWLGRCEEIYIVGYSMPSSDISMKMMLRHIFQQKMVKKVYIVNASRKAKKATLTEFGDFIEKFDFKYLGKDSVKKMANDFYQEQ